MLNAVSLACEAVDCSTVPNTASGSTVPAGCTCAAGYSGTIVAAVGLSDGVLYFTGSCEADGGGGGGDAEANDCTCSNGVAAAGAACAVHDSEACDSCEAGYWLNAEAACEAVACSTIPNTASGSTVPAGCTCAA
eukprot:SAG22_NODE_12935_length_424_cov_0.944615_1_plen_134_part_10